MHFFTLRNLSAATMLLAASTVVAEAQARAYALTTTAGSAQQLLSFSRIAPSSVTTLGPTGVSVTGSDFRPATNQLYGYGGDKLYIVNAATGSATLAFDVGNTTGNAGFDFATTQSIVFPS